LAFFCLSAKEAMKLGIAPHTGLSEDAKLGCCTLCSFMDRLEFDEKDMVPAASICLTFEAASKEEHIRVVPLSRDFDVFKKTLRGESV
jgi:hypothetical protein